jgi:hypothetical protein
MLEAPLCSLRHPSVTKTLAQRVHQTLFEHIFRQVPSSECLLINDRLVLLFFVDDVIVMFCCSADTKFRVFRAALLARYEMRVLGDFKWFLNIWVIGYHWQR